jgi:catechol-2,3-dioxygenase
MSSKSLNSQNTKLEVVVLPVSDVDRAKDFYKTIATFNPELERFFMARRIGAETTEIKASHVSFISHPTQVVNRIEAAATAAMN